MASARATVTKRARSSFGLKEILHQLPTLIFHHSGSDAGLGMEGMGSIEGIAALGIGGAIDDSVYLGPAEGSSAHHARFDGDIEGAALEIFSTEKVGGRGDGLHLGMGGDIVEGFGEVGGAGDDAVATHDDSSDGYLVGIEGYAGLLEGL